MWVLRNEHGNIICLPGNIAVSKIFSEVPGEWKEKNFVKGGKQTVYVVTESRIWNVPDVRIPLYPGYYLLKE